MSEFKYACPVCGQHIKCDSSQAGTVMDCPTCFQKITVPQAPTGDDQKFILTGTKVGEKRTSSLPAAAGPKTVEPAKALPVVAFILILVLLAGAGVYFFGGKILHLHSNWQSADIGAVGVAGTFSQTGGTLNIGGSGADIWGQTDAFQYVYRNVNGDVSLTARVVGIQNTDPWAKAGLMVRESTAPDSAYATVVVTANNGVAFQQRSGTGSQATSVQIIPRLHTPYWVRLTRKEDTFTAESSADGTAWTPAGSTTVAMKKDAYAGLAVTAHNYATLCQATFDHVAISGASTPKVSPESVGDQEKEPTEAASKPKAPPANDTNWMLVLGTNAIPDSPVAGRIHGQDFLVERAALQNGSLMLRSGSRSTLEFGAIINFSGALAEDLSGKTINVKTNAEKAAPVTLRWKDADGKVQKENYDAGYALRLEFGTLANNRLRGKIYLCAPDSQKTYLAGSFNADARKPKPKQNSAPK